MMHIQNLVTNWWSPVLRGVAAIIFGVFALAFPGITLSVFLIAFGLYAFVEGLFNVIMALRGVKTLDRWGVLLFHGLVSMAFGVFTLIWPKITALALLLTIALWAVVTGILEIATAIRVRKEVKGEWLLALMGVLSIAFGVVLFLRPVTGILSLVWLVAAYAIFFGVLLIGFGLRLKSFMRDTEVFRPQHA